MKKLTKLNAKKIAQIENIVGGKLGGYDLTVAVESGGSGESHYPTKSGTTGHYVCDHVRDAV